MSSVDLMGNIIEFLGEGALLPLLMTSREFRRSTRAVTYRVGRRKIKSSSIYFTSSVCIAEWAKSMGCPLVFLCTHAARTHGMDILEWAMDICSVLVTNTELICQAAWAGDVEMIVWLLSHGCTVTPNAFFNAASRGHLDTIIYLGKLSSRTSYAVAGGAVDGGHIHILEWLCESDGTAHVCPELCALAAYKGHLPVLQYFREKAGLLCPWDIKSYNEAARRGNVYVLKWLRTADSRCSWDVTTCAAAAMEGQLTTLMWLRDENCPWDLSTLQTAAKAGHKHILELLKESNYFENFWTKEILHIAAGKGYVAILKWLKREFPCLFDESIIETAIEGGDINMLKWLDECFGPPCLWDESCCQVAASFGDLQVLKWLRYINDPPCPWNEFNCCSAAIKEGHLHILKWMKENCSGHNWIPPDACQISAANGKLPVLKWLRNEVTPSSPWSESTCASAARGGHYDVLVWLRQENDPPCPWDETTFASALEGGDHRVIAYCCRVIDPCPRPWYISDNDVNLL